MCQDQCWDFDEYVKYKYSKDYLNTLCLWSPYGIEQTIIFSSCHLFFFFLSSLFPRLISAVADWMSAILAHMVWPWCEFKMQV